jgi:tol-pal system protein YbgF
MNKPNSSRRVLALAAATIAGVTMLGCAASSDMDQLQNNEFALRGMVANDRQQIEALLETVARQNDRITELEHGGGSPGDVTKLQDQVSKLQAQLAATQPQASPSPGEGIPGVGPDLASAPSPAAAFTPAPAQQAAPPPTWQAAASQELRSAQNDPGAKLYRTGLTEMRAGKYQPALAKFQDLQRRYPKSTLSEPAEYFSANALYELGQYEKSILQFNDVTMRFPEGRYASAALLREAQAFMKINDQIDARLTLQKLLNDHPSAAEAPMARSMMDSLSS